MPIDDPVLVSLVEKQRKTFDRNATEEERIKINQQILDRKEQLRKENATN